jgi:hypothetical protein
VIEVKGGLGNQMFQYAAARSLAMDLGAQLLVERKLGFLLDRQYRRTFELNKLPAVFSDSTFRDSSHLYFLRLRAFKLRWMGGKQKDGKSTKYVLERDFSFIDFKLETFKGKRVWMSGYFQDPRYFFLHKEKILTELTPPPPKDNRYLKLGELSKNFTLIALGIRLFEESTSPNAHAKDGKSKTIEEFMVVLNELLKITANPRVLVFTTKHFKFLDSLNLPAETVFINSDRGFHETADKLWMLSKCQHHIFNNSSFYWWGAALSEINFEHTEQHIYYSDNFLNQDIGQPSWKKF